MCKAVEFCNIWLTVCVRGRVKHENLVLSKVCSHERLTLEKSALKSFTVVIHSLATRLIKPNFNKELDRLLQRKITSIKVELFVG